MQALTDREKEALKLFKKELQETFSNQMKEFKLFGSKARGEAGKFSDVDVLVVLNSDDWRDKSKVHAVANRVFLETDVDFAPRIFTVAMVQTLRAHGSPLLANIDREGIAL